MIKVLADKHLYNITHFLPADIDLTLFDPSEALNAETIAEHTDALLIRTVNQINPETFPYFPDRLSFIATGSAGTDHIDQEYLQRSDITFAHAGGCNARSVGEYIAVALLLWAEQLNEDLSKHRVGIIGAGHTGEAVRELLQKLEVETVAYDPPRAEREAAFDSATIEEVLTCGILTFHTPLTQSGPHPTFHWFSEENLDGHNFKLVINASRGGVIDEQALIKAFDYNSVENFILDVWENEPDFMDETARRAFIKTPHIAGYSTQAKQRASQMIAEAMARHFSIGHEPSGFKPGRQTSLENHASGKAQQPKPDTFWSLTDALTHYHPVKNYETRFKMLIGRNSEAKIRGFNRIRTGQPFRDEFSALNISQDLKEQFPALKVLAKD